MRPLLTTCLALTVALAGCQTAKPTGTPVRPGAVPSTRVTPPSATSPGPTAAPARVIPPASKLLPLTGAATTLTGLVVLDAAYALRTGAGTPLIGQDGNSLIGMDGAALGPGGETLNASGRMVAAGGGNLTVPAGLVGRDGALLIGQDGNSLIGQDGNSLIGQDGNSLIGQDGNSLIGQDGNSMVAAGGGNYALAQLTPTKPGEAWPAVGMWVSIVDTRTGYTVPLGRDEKGPVHTIYTDAAGKFAVQVPTDVAPFARVIARAPGRRDARLVLSVTAPPVDKPIRIDADTTLTSNYLRQVFAARMLDAFVLDPTQIESYFGPASKAANSTAGNQALAALATEQFQELHKALNEIGALSMAPERQQELALLMADRLIAGGGAEVVRIGRDADTVQDESSRDALANQPALDVIKDVLVRVREAANARAATNGFGWFAEQPYIREANLRRAPAERWTITRGEDLVNFIVREYLSENNDALYRNVYFVLDSLDGFELTDRDRLRNAGKAYVYQMMQTLILADQSGEPGTRAVAKLVRETGAALVSGQSATYVPPAPVLAPPPVPVAPAFPTMTVDTIAGAYQEAGAIDGPGSTARFGLISGLAIDPRPGLPHTLYASDDDGHVRRIRVDAEGVATVDTLDAAFGTLGGIAVDPTTGDVIVTEPGARVVSRLTVAADGTTVRTTLAGTYDTPPGYVDGPGLSARFGHPSGLTVASDGTVVVTDFTNHRIRAIAPNGTVTTVTGAGLERAREGPRLTAQIETPVAVAAEPTGGIWFLQGNGTSVSRLGSLTDPTARTSVVAGGFARLDSYDGYWVKAWFVRATGITRYTEGRYLIAEAGGNRIRIISPDGWVGTLAGGPGRDEKDAGHRDGPGATALLDEPQAVVAAADGTVYVAERRGHILRRLKPTTP